MMIEEIEFVFIGGRTIYTGASSVEAEYSALVLNHN